MKIGRGKMWMITYTDDVNGREERKTERHDEKI